jgi:hypothetical protein
VVCTRGGTPASAPTSRTGSTLSGAAVECQGFVKGLMCVSSLGPSPKGAEPRSATAMREKRCLESGQYMRSDDRLECRRPTA